MAQRSRGPQRALATGSGAVGGLEAGPTGVDEVLAEVGRHLDRGQPGEAIEAIRRSNARSPRLMNALGVCQLRLGGPGHAVEIFRDLVVKDGIHLRDGVPPAFKVNLAAALLAAGNLDGFLSVLGEIGDDEHPAVPRYREAYRRWRAGLSAWQRFKNAVTGRHSEPFVPDFALGEL